MLGKSTSWSGSGRVIALSVLSMLAAASCGSDPAEPAASFPSVEADGCIVMLHGKGGNAQRGELVGDVARVFPAGNGEGWGARQWSYETDDEYAEAVAVVRSAIDDSGCTQAVVHGFSNGGAFAAKLYCGGDTLGGRLVGVVIDDPVTDATTVGCDPDPAVDATLYWTGALEQFVGNGRDCGGLDWTCAGGDVFPIDVYAASAGLEVTRSPLTEHDRYDDAPDPLIWLSAAAG